LSLFHSGKGLFDRFRVSIESEITFSDYCRELLFPDRDHIIFTSKALIITYPKDGFESIQDDWLEVEHLEFYPWDNVLTLQNIRGDKVLEEFDKTQIMEWLSTICDPQIDYPYINVRKGNIAFIVAGNPRSVRSRGGRMALRRQVESRREEINRVYPQPFKRDVEMKIEVFMEDIHRNERPDIDRLSTLIADAFQGIAYLDDKQIRDLRPRIIDVSEAFKKLECRTTLMNSFSLDDIPIGSVFPLAIGMKSYYVVRIIHYN
jgi:Holliday junction resolvase RusA-like endonuclease